MFRDTQVSNCWLTHVSPSYPHCIILCPHHTVSQFYHITSHNIPIIILCMMSYCIPRISRFYTITFPYPHNILLIIYIIKNIPIIEYPQNISIIMWCHITWSPTYPYNIPTISSHPQLQKRAAGGFVFAGHDFLPLNLAHAYSGDQNWHGESSFFRLLELSINNRNSSFGQKLQYLSYPCQNIFSQPRGLLPASLASRVWTTTAPEAVALQPHTPGLV